MRSSVEVHNFLAERGIQHELFSARGRLRTPERIAAVLDLPPGEVGAIWIFEGKGNRVAAVVPSDREPELEKVNKATGTPSLKAASPRRAAELTGYLAESIPPAGLPPDFKVLIDKSFDREAVLYFPGGQARSILKIRGRDLARATRAKVAALSRPREPGRAARGLATRAEKRPREAAP